jgi:PAS domain S-box-containing protein
VWRIPALVVLYVVAGKIDLRLAFLHPSASPVWAPSGIALAAFLVIGYRAAAAIFFAAFLVNVTTFGSALSSMGIALGNTCEAALGACLIQRYAHGRNVLDRLPDILKFVLVAGVLSPAVAATVGVTSLSVAGYAPWAGYHPIWWTWWLGDGAGHLLVTPLFLLFSTHELAVTKLRRRGVESAFFFASIAVTGLLVFGGPFQSHAPSYPLTFVCIPVLAWAAFRFSRWEVAVAIVVLGSIAIEETLRGHGPFSGAAPNESLLLLQAFMAVLAVTMLPVSTLVWERRRVQEALLTAIPHQVWGCRPDGSLTYCNKQWLDFTGLPLEDAQREGCTARIHPADAERARKSREEAARQRAPYEVEVRLRAADGRYRRFLSRAAALYDERGEVHQWFGTNTDVEERRQVDDALQKAQAELARVTRLTTVGELTVSLAHELNQPLAGVITNSQACLRWLKRDPSNLDEAMSAAQRIIRDAARASDVMAHTRAFLQRSAAERLPLDLAQVVRASLVLIASEVLRHGAVLHEQLPESLPLVAGDRVQLQQVLLNLILNGLEAMEHVADRSRELVIAAEPCELRGSPAVLLAVQDTGSGVDEENLDRLFEAFYTRKPGGLGMGLSISRSIVEAHEGQLWATRNTGAGMTFHLALPALKSEAR